MAQSDSLSDLARRWYDGQVGTGVQVATSVEPKPSVTSPTLIPYTNAALGAAALVGAAWRRVHYANVQNANAAAVFIQFFNAATAGAVTLGTTVPIFWLAVPSGGILDTGFLAISPGAFPAGVVVAATTTPNGATVVTTPLAVTLAGI